MESEVNSILRARCNSLEEIAALKNQIANCRSMIVRCHGLLDQFTPEREVAARALLSVLKQKVLGTDLANTVHNMTLNFTRLQELPLIYKYGQSSLKIINQLHRECAYVKLILEDLSKILDSTDLRIISHTALHNYIRRIYTIDDEIKTISQHITVFQGLGLLAIKLCCVGMCTGALPVL
jgi:hypothetical protein